MQLTLPDLIVLAAPASVLAALAAALVAMKVHRLFGTGLSLCLLLLALSITAVAFSSVWGEGGTVANSVADVCAIIAGVAAIAADRWLRRTFEIGEWYEH